MKKTRRKGEPSSKAWGWVMEKLADLKQVDTPLIDDLLRKIPCGSDSLPSCAKERLALRRLDELFDSTAIASSKRSSSASESSVIDISKSAQDIYSHLASIKGASSSRASMLDSFKLEAHRFTLQKKACLPKCVIQQLAEVLIEGGQPYISVLRGTSEEVLQKLDQIRNGIIAQTPEVISTPSVPENPGNHLQDDISSKPSSSTRKKVRFTDENPTVHYANDVVNDPVVRTEVEIATSSVPEYQTDDLRGGHVNDVVGSHKRTRREIVDQQHTHSEDSVTVEPAEHISDPMIMSERSGCLNDNTLSYDQNGATNSANRKLVQDLQDNITIVDEDVDDSERVAKRVKVSSNANQPGFISSGDNTRQETLEVRLCGNNSQTDLEAPQSNVGNSSQGKQAQDMQEDVGCGVNDIDKGTQKEALQDGFCGRHCLTEPEALRGNAEISGKGTQVQNLHEDVLVDDDDVNCEHLSKRPKVGKNLTVQDQPETIGSSDSTHQKAPVDGPHGNSNRTEPESPRGNVEHPDRISSTNMTGARSTLNQDSTGKNWLEKETCVKCNGDDELLFCSGSACYVAVHERCLGSPASFDNADNFYCPYCTYSRANLACHELVKKLSEAKKIAHLAKIQFNQFMQGYKRNELSEMPSKGVQVSTDR